MPFYEATDDEIEQLVWTAFKGNTVNHAKHYRF